MFLLCGVRIFSKRAVKNRLFGNSGNYESFTSCGRGWKFQPMLHGIRRSFKHRVAGYTPKRSIGGSYPGVDGCFSESAGNKKNLTVDLLKNSKLRAVIFSIDVLTGSDHSIDKQERQIADGSVAPAVETSVIEQKVYDTSKEIEGVTGVQSKYMKAISAKLGGRSIQGIGSNSDSGMGVKKATDGELLGVGKKLAAEKAKENEGEQAASSWMLAPGMGNLLDYCYYRTMHLGRYILL